MSRSFVATNSEAFTCADPISSAPLSISCWVYIPTAIPSGDDCFVQIANTSVTNNYFRLGVADQSNSPTDALRFVTYSGSGSFSLAEAVTSNSMSADTWQHCCAIEESSTSRISVLNGDWANRGTNSGGNEVPTSINQMAVGWENDSSPADYLTGHLAHVAIWNVALTQGEAEALSKGYSPLLIRPGSLIFYAPLNRDSGDEYDLIGGLTLTDVNTVGTGTTEPRTIHPYSQQIFMSAAAGGVSQLAGQFGGQFVGQFGV